MLIASKNIIITLLLCTTLIGCASTQTGQVFNNQELAPFSKNNAQLVIYRPSAFAMPRTPVISINGVEKCELPGNSYMVIETKATKDIAITTSLWDYPGISKLILKAEPGKRYFIKVNFDTNTNVGSAFGAIGGAIGGLVADDTPPHEGPFIIQKVYPEYAVEQLKDAQQTLACK